jgi:hypothetical protein
MLRYFTSGIAEPWLGSVAAKATISVLVDLTDEPNVRNFYTPDMIAIDSGAYRMFKNPRRNGALPTIEEAMAYRGRVENHGYNYAMMMALDAIGSPGQTILLYRKVFANSNFVPVWQWGALRRDLDYYIGMAPSVQWLDYMDSPRPVVAIGGLAGTLRGGHNEKDPKERKRKDDERDKAIDELEAICRKYPGLFHILGLNSPEAINRIAPLVLSADSSKWIDAYRYRYAVFVNTRTGRLQHAPARSIPEYARLEKDDLAMVNARNITTYAEASKCANTASP